MEGRSYTSDDWHEVDEPPWESPAGDRLVVPSLLGTFRGT